MDFIFWAKIIIMVIIVLELILRFATPLTMPVGTTSFSKQFNTPFIIRVMITAYIAVNLESISEKIAAFLPDGIGAGVATYPIWLLPVLAYSVYAITAQQNEKKKATQNH